jgi:hypothetical protein
MGWTWELIAFAFFLGWAMLLAAQPAAEDRPIIVEGRIKEVVGDFVANMTQAGPTDQLGRWNREICPTVIGIDQAQEKFVEDRIVQVGRMVGLRGGKQCATSLAVIVTPQPDSLVYELVRRRDCG